MENILENYFSLAHIGLIIVFVMAFNAFLTGLYKGLEMIKDKTSNNVDNKAYEMVGKVINLLQKFIEIVGPLIVKPVSDSPPSDSKPG